MIELLAEITLGSLVARYVQPAGTARCELHLLPISMVDETVAPRRTLEDRPEILGLPQKFKPIDAISPGSLVHLKLQQDDTGYGFASGVTMAESATMFTLAYEGIQVKRPAPTPISPAGKGSATVVETTLRDTASRFRCIHRLHYTPGEPGVRSSTEFVNESKDALSLELLTSFALNGLTPFEAGSATPHLTFHRFRSWWSLEGRQDSAGLEVLHMERSWGGFGLFSERFGQVGTMPVRRWFPFAAVEDTTHGVVWAAQLAWAGSWQMELMRKGDRVTLCGGLADREFGHWVKHIQPGESFHTPEALLTVVAGTLDDACQALTTMQRGALEISAPPVEAGLPICFNEWCTSWGNPTHDNVLAIARRLQGCGVRYIVIDDGWAVRPPDALLQSNGDWIVDESKFPGGLKHTCDALRSMGYIPGIWFEFEVINPGATVWNETTHMVQRDGRPLQVGSRRFWDFTDPWVHNYLLEKVIRLLKENGIGYLKVDYNDNLGIGCDCADSLGEGLRRHVEGVQRFFHLLRREIPDLVIENCSSGGHRLEPSMQALASMGSFSDAHEPIIIPIVARNLQRLILPQQSLIWAVLHPSDDEPRLIFSLAATFLGRMCLSGEIHDLHPWQLDALRQATALYTKAGPIVSRGTSQFYGTPDNSYVDPLGWQAIVRTWENKALVVAHSFNQKSESAGDDDGKLTTLSIPLPFSDARITDSLAPQFASASVQKGQFTFRLPPGCQGGVWLMQTG
ncbi:alpha-galactosidase [Verrucomicrobia bacterium LW23]|nr:alpha-galactosidase [Verrucomicrobia bacterium LW23]